MSASISSHGKAKIERAAACGWVYDPQGPGPCRYMELRRAWRKDIRRARNRGARQK